LLKFKLDLCAWYKTQVEATFDEVTRQYVVRTLTPCPKYNQIFINYGPHSNKHLLLNYGFIADNNPHDVCPVAVGNVCNCVEFGNASCLYTVLCLYTAVWNTWKFEMLRIKRVMEVLENLGN